MVINKYTDRLSGSPLEKELTKKLHQTAPEEIRVRLFSYLARYNEDYHFSHLENAFPLMSKTLYDGVTLSEEEKSLIQEEIEYGMYEYFISLNHISEALSILFRNQSLNMAMVCQIINHAWEAYSCNETEFIVRESEYLSKNL